MRCARADYAASAAHAWFLYPAVHPVTSIVDRPKTFGFQNGFRPWRGQRSRHPSAPGAAPLHAGGAPLADEASLELPAAPPTAAPDRATLKSLKSLSQLFCLRLSCQRDSNGGWPGRHGVVLALFGPMTAPRTSSSTSLPSSARAPAICAKGKKSATTSSATSKGRLRLSISLVDLQEPHLPDLL
jgi:hypothetical protein